MATRSKRVVKTEFVSKTGVSVIDKKCRQCRKTKSPSEYYQAFDLYLDTDGLMSVCKSCCLEIFDESLLRERMIKKSILATCRILNILFYEKAVDSVLASIDKADEEGKPPPHAFSTYLVRLRVMVARGKTIESGKYTDLTFLEPAVPVNLSDKDREMVSHSEFWGEGLPTKDVEYLEREFANFREGYSAETYTETVLLKTICYKLLDIKKAREGNGKGLGALEKELLALMKEAAISPAHATAASSGMMKDTFGVWVEQIEKYAPAEWLKNEAKDLFWDVDNISKYFEDYFVRPLKNFITGNPDYALTQDYDDMDSIEE